MCNMLQLNKAGCAPLDSFRMFTLVFEVITLRKDYVGDGITWPVIDGCDQYTLTVCFPFVTFNVHEHIIST